MYCMLCLVFYAMHSLHCCFPLYYMHFILCIIFYALIICIVFFAFFYMHHIQCIFIYTLYSLHFFDEFYPKHCILCIILCNVFYVLHYLRFIQSILFLLHSFYFLLSMNVELTLKSLSMDRPTDGHCHV